jgi:uncharacterized protein (TIGR02145 family)
MKNVVLALILFSFSTNEIKSQTVIGKLVDENGEGLSGIFLQLYINPNVYNSTSLGDGSFIFDNITYFEDEQLPTGYEVSNNFPNPFNPTTRIIVTLPNSGNVKVAIYNTLGEIVTNEIERYFNTGTNYIDIELNGLPNGFYISRITIDDKYTVVKKLMLIYGSQHLTTSSGPIHMPLNKPKNTYLETNIDSLVATSSIIGRKTFTNLPSIISDTLDLGNLTIERYCPGTPTVLYEGKTYHTVQIGNQCWLKENIDIGTRINGNLDQTDNSIIEKYCYDDDPNNCTTYGGLYQWNEAMQYVANEGAQGICPPGWHLPTLAEYQALAAAVNNDGNALKREDQGNGSGQGTNTSGFSALLAGIRNYNGNFDYLGYYADFWSSTEYNADNAYRLYLLSDDGSVLLYQNTKDYGFSVRCIKD